MAPNRKLLYKGDVNRIYDDEYKAEQSAKKEKLFIRPTRQRKMKNAKWFAIGMGIDLPFCIILLILLTIGTIMMFSASYAFAYYTQNPQNRAACSRHSLCLSAYRACASCRRRRRKALDPSGHVQYSALRDREIRGYPVLRALG